jgi:hypothetical protein
VFQTLVLENGRAKPEEGRADVVADELIDPRTVALAETASTRYV